MHWHERQKHTSQYHIIKTHLIQGALSHHNGHNTGRDIERESYFIQWVLASYLLHYNQYMGRLPSHTNTPPTQLKTTNISSLFHCFLRISSILMMWECEDKADNEAKCKLFCCSILMSHNILFVVLQFFCVESFLFALCHAILRG
eukprot:124466_1